MQRSLPIRGSTKCTGAAEPMCKLYSLTKGMTAPAICRRFPDLAQSLHTHAPGP
jgi:hypothetical protein